jgi:hypothetical protein
LAWFPLHLGRVAERTEKKMIIWHGKGFLVFVLVCICSWTTLFITNAVSGGDRYWEVHKWPFGVSLICAGILSWFIGKYLASRKTRTLIDKETGQEVVIEPFHAFFFLRMHWWGPILALIGTVFIVVDLLRLA